MRHPFPGPGLAIRVLCAEEPYMERDFSETQVLIKIIVDFDQMLQKKHALLNRVEGVTSDEERLEDCVMIQSILVIILHFQVNIKKDIEQTETGGYLASHSHGRRSR